MRGEDIINIQKQWASGIVKMGELSNDRDSLESFTSDFLDKIYDFDNQVLFKPTKAAIEQFRNSKGSAYSYFIAGDDRACNEDKGFAINPWTKVRFENSGIIIDGDRAIAMGNYYFTDLSGGEAKVEYTFGYKLIDGKLKIDLHHSSFPYSH